MYCKKYTRSSSSAVGAVRLVVGGRLGPGVSGCCVASHAQNLTWFQGFSQKIAQVQGFSRKTSTFAPARVCSYSRAVTSPPLAPGRWLESAKAVPTLNRGPLLEHLPQLAVVHYTAGRSAANTIRRFRDPASQVSAHFVVAEDGQVTQMVDCQRKAWHAGTSSIALPDGTTLRSLNGCSIGFELDYDGWLTTLTGGRRARTEADALYVKSRWWPKYDQRQIDALVNTIDELRVRDWLASPCYLTGHEHIAPGRKLDPGPAFPWSEVCERTQLTRLPPLG